MDLDRAWSGRPESQGDSRTQLVDAPRTIERLSTALRARHHAANDPIAVVGMGCRLPGGADQRAVIGAAPPDHLSYVEASGAGTSLCGPIERNALEATIGRHHGKCGSLLVGSVKTNVGHLRLAAGAAGFLMAPARAHMTSVPPAQVWAATR